MDKFFNSTFDALTNVIPGSVILASLLVLDSGILTIDDYLLTLNKIELGSAGILIFISYVIGFAISPIGKFLYQKIGFKIWPLKIEDNSNLSISDKFVLIREYSPNNFKYVESWNMFCTLAHNLAISSIVLIVICLIRDISFDNLGNLTSISIIAAGLALFFIFINRAVVFRKWALNDLNTAVDRLELLGKIKSGSKKYEIKLKKE